MAFNNFDRVSDVYDATRGFPPGIAAQIADWVLSRLPADPTIFEVGVGTGRIALPFVERNIRYTGFDISEQMLGQAYQKLGGDLRRAHLVLADITQPLPLDDQTQDAAIAVHILHLVDAEKALTQVRRALKPHGAILWGYQLHADHSPKKLIRDRFNSRAAALGSPRQRDFFMPVARDLLAAWGAQVSKHVVTSWTALESPRSILDHLAQRVLSSTWDMAEPILQSAVAEAEAWAVSQYGDLNQPRPAEERFCFDWYQF